MDLIVNGSRRSFDSTLHTVADLIRELALEGKRIAVDKNGEVIPRSLYAQTPVAPGDTLEIVGAVGGG